MKLVLDYGMRGHIVEVCTNITLVVIYKLHEISCIPCSVAHFVKKFAIQKTTSEEAQALSASLAALSLQRCQISH